MKVLIPPALLAAATLTALFLGWDVPFLMLAGAGLTSTVYAAGMLDAKEAGERRLRS